MPTVTGSLTDFGLAALAPFNPTIVFTPSGPAINGSRILATRPIEVTPAADGSFSVVLADTSALNPATWFEIKIVWQNPAGGYVGVDFPDWQLFVPTNGGQLPILLNVPVNPAQVWVDEIAPTNPTPGLWWLNPTTGDLKEWS